MQRRRNSKSGGLPGSRACPCRLGRAASFAMAAESPQVPGEPGDKAESDPTTEAERLPEAVEEAAAALRREFEDQLAKGYDYSNESMCSAMECLKAGDDEGAWAALARGQVRFATSRVSTP